MTRKGSSFAGLSVAITTPFRHGKVDVPALKEQIDFQVAAGTRCVCPVGTTGESPTLSHDEHDQVISEVVQAVAGRMKVMAGTGSNSTSEALRLTKYAAGAQADAALLVAPYYNKPSQEGFYQHYKAIAEECDLPICVYNIPGRTCKNVEPETIIRLAELENIAMIKDATGSTDQASQILGATDLTILSGDDSMTLPLLSVGGEGVISVVRQHRSAGHDCTPEGLPRWRCRRSTDSAPPPVCAVQGSTGAGNQSHSDQGGNAPAGARHRRAAAPHDTAGRRRHFETPQNADGLRSTLMNQEDFDVAGLAKYLHITPQQVERLASRGKVPGRKVAGQWRFSPAEIHHWMEERMGLLENDELQRVETALAGPSSADGLPLSRMLAVESVAVPLTAKTKRSVIAEMVELASQTGILWDPDRMIEAVQSREQMQSTAMPNGVALLHPRRPLANILGEPILALGVSPQGIPFGGARSLTSVFFLICSTDDRGHLRTLARLSRMLQEPTLVNKLQEAEDAQQAREWFEQMESELAE